MSQVVYLITVRPVLGVHPHSARSELTQSPLFLSQGANRPDGIGFATVQTLLKDPNANIVAAVRDPDSAAELKELAASVEGRLALVKMDISTLETVKVCPSTCFAFVSIQC